MGLYLVSCLYTNMSDYDLPRNACADCISQSKNGEVLGMVMHCDLLVNKSRSSLKVNGDA